MRKSIELAELDADSFVVEIGPGLGTLTKAILKSGASLWTVERDTSQVIKRPIEVGVPSRKQVPVLAGLELGEQVVAAGGAWLYDGMQVRPLGDG